MLNQIYKKISERIRARPLNVDGKVDGSYNFLHRVDAISLCEEAFELGISDNTKTHIEFLESIVNETNSYSDKEKLSIIKEMCKQEIDRVKKEK